ncbi:MAG: hypothetical protein M3452_04650 [Chloroflexota bacterium]|nr:hypothetical protein [Chloroflexota bacterium]
MLAPLIFAVLAVGLLTPAMSLVGPRSGASAAENQPPRLAEFLWGLAGQESGWRYGAENPASGAYGKYQIMPFNWPNWSRDFIGDPHAPQTGINQEIVAAGKVSGLHRWLGRYDRVAYWWLSGRSDPDRSNWSAYARNYVANVMSLMDRAPAGGDGPTPTRPDTGLERGDALRLRGSFSLRAGPSWPSAALLRLPRRSEVTVLRSKWVPIGGEPRAWVRLEAPDGTRGWVRYRILAARTRG